MLCYPIYLQISTKVQMTSTPIRQLHILLLQSMTLYRLIHPLLTRILFFLSLLKAKIPIKSSLSSLEGQIEFADHRHIVSFILTFQQINHLLVTTHPTLYPNTSHITPFPSHIKISFSMYRPMLNHNSTIKPSILLIGRKRWLSN